MQKRDIKLCIWLASVVVLGCVSQSAHAQAYTELYRPQFHFSRQSGWIGDPDGTIRYKNVYHLFGWDHYVSPDLVFWASAGWPMRGDDGSFAYFSGSVVVDTNNSSGFGSMAKPAMVAFYTAHQKSDGRENQRISVSTNYSMFSYYANNPVLDIGYSDGFRDPDVFWDKQSSRWIMGVSMFAQRKINYYASGNLKSWQYISSFGPIGARDQVWEVPNLVQLPVNSDVSRKKWVQFCGMGPNKVQYFVGDFNGTEFTMDASTIAYLTQGVGLEGETFETFEASDYGAWTKTGNAFGAGPASGTLPAQATVSGYLGGQCVSSYNGGDSSTGLLRSPDFTITKNCINFLIGGGDQPGTACINLIVGGNVVRTATGQNSEILKRGGWDVSQWKGQTARIEIADNATGGWGHILIDHIMFSDVLMNQRIEHANWVDGGSDFYAPRAYRDYDNVEQCTTWLGWMGNWEYAKVVPTSWGQGVLSIPRRMELRTSAKGYELIQTPLPRLEKLREVGTNLPPRTVQDIVALPGFQPVRNTYELEAIFNLHASNQNFGLNLCVAGGNKVVVGYDAATSNLYLDRRNSGNVGFSPAFPRLVTMPYVPATNCIKFHVFVDQSTIEVFVNDGEKVFTSLIFPDSASRGIQLFSVNGPTTLRSLSAWPMKSIW